MCVRERERKWMHFKLACTPSCEGIGPATVCLCVCACVCAWGHVCLEEWCSGWPRTQSIKTHAFIFQTHTACTDKELCVRGRSACVWCQLETEKGSPSYPVNVCVGLSPDTRSLTPLVTDACYEDDRSVRFCLRQGNYIFYSSFLFSSLSSSHIHDSLHNRHSAVYSIVSSKQTLPLCIITDRCRVTWL